MAQPGVGVERAEVLEGEVAGVAHGAQVGDHLWDVRDALFEGTELPAPLPLPVRVGVSGDRARAADVAVGEGAETLAARGAAVIIADLQREKAEAVAAALAAEGRTAAAALLDVTSTAEVDALFAEVAETRGRLDVLDAGKNRGGDDRADPPGHPAGPLGPSPRTSPSAWPPSAIRTPPG